MRTRSTAAGVVVAVLLVGGLGTGPVGAEDEAGAPTTEPPPPAAVTEPAPEAAAEGGADVDGGDEGPAADGVSASAPDDPTDAPADPATADPATADPTAADPTAADPTAADPAAPDPATTDPTAAGPATTDPTAAGPATTDPVADLGTADTGAGDSNAPEAPSAPSSTTPPATAATSTAELAPAATAPPPVVSVQDATIDAESVAVADTGHITAVNGPAQVIVVDQADPAAGDTAGGGDPAVGLALVVTGDASAIGGATDDSISQKALVKAVGTGEIEIIQIALVVNLGVAVANTGGNSATGLDAVAGTATNGTAGAGSVSTGDATAVGNVSDVRVVQAADAAAGTGTVASLQAADIASLGVAFGNTGLNVVIGNTVLQLVVVDQVAAGGGGGRALTALDQGAATSGASGVAAITTGTAGATGNASSTTVDQLATADAGDGGFVSILQRALVLNLGIALANSGTNTAVGNQSVDLVDVQRQSIAGAFWASLQSLFGGTGWLDLPSSGTGTGAIGPGIASEGAALVTTGDATAIGLAATTQVAQAASGSAEAGGQALVVQDATVTNGGLAIANTGANSAAGVLTLNAIVTDQWAGLGAYLSEYLGLLGAGTATAAPSTSSWALGDVLVDLFGEIHADEVLIDGFAGLSGGQVEAALAEALGFAAGVVGIEGSGPSASGPRIRVRQVTGTLTINLGIASSGGDAARSYTVDVAVVDQEADPASEAQVSNALGPGVRAAVQALADGTLTGDTAVEPENLAVLINATTGAAVVATGDATAATSTAIVVCQTFAVPAACAPPATPPSPAPPSDPAGAPGVVAGPGTASDPGGSTAGTGSTRAAPVRSGGSSPAAANAGSASPASASGELPRSGADVLPLARAGAALVAVGALLVAVAARRRALATGAPRHLV